MGNPANAPSHWKRIQQQERAAEIINLRKEGLTFRQIADRLGIDKSHAVHTVTNYLRKVITEPSEELLQMELMKLEDLYRAAREAMETFTPVMYMGVPVTRPLYDRNGYTVMDPNGDPVIVAARDFSPVLFSVNTCLRVMEQRAKLLGLNAPARTQQMVIGSPGGEVTWNVVDSKADIEGLKKEVQAFTQAVRHPDDPPLANGCAVIEMETADADPQDGLVDADDGATERPTVTTPADGGPPYRMFTDAD